jgi:PAS domain S-box-containing protein
MTTSDPIRTALAIAATGLLVLNEHMRIVWANSALERMTGLEVSGLEGRRPWDVLPELLGSPEARAVRRTRADGRTRTFRIGYRDNRLSGVFDVRVARAPNRHLLLEVHDVSALLDPEPSAPDENEEAELLRVLARALAETEASDEIARVLVDLTQRATKAAVVSVSAIEGPDMVVLHCVGGILPQAGSTLPLAGTMTERVAETRAVIRCDRYFSSQKLLLDMVEASGVGEVLAVPLMAYDRVVGALLIGMPANAPPLGDHAERRMRLLAEHVALPLWRTRLLEQAQAADRAKTNFLATVSHELRTPLTALAGYGELLADGILGEMTAQQTDTVERMRAVTHHLSVLIDEILAFSNLEGGREQLHLANVDARTLARQVATISEPLAFHKHIEFELDLPGEDIQFVSDGSKIRQILVNLTGNAVKFTERGRVVMRVRREGEEVSFAVEDTGLGIAEADRQRLFQAFAQLEEGLTRRHGGTGLGLYVSRRLAELLHGRIELHSRPGGGSVFKLYLPLTGLPG